MTEQGAYYGMVDRKQTDKWDFRLVELAEHISQWSKDPSTKVGAVIADPISHIVKGVGYNGLPRGVCDTRVNDRADKLELIIHAEVNALLNSNGSVYGATCYTTHPPCSQCAAKLIQSGIKRVVYTRPTIAFAERWGMQGVALMRSVGIQITELL